MSRRPNKECPVEATLDLRELERNGIIRRRIYACVPPQVEYSLAPLGRRLAPVFDAMYAWGLRYLQTARGPATTRSKENGGD
jgi:DNA-binding HxlR family transcriptional regulator